jgi:hypothetical protein
VALVSVAAFLVAIIEPVAGGSGIPEIKVRAKLAEKKVT